MWVVGLRGYIISTFRWKVGLIFADVNSAHRDIISMLSEAAVFGMMIVCSTNECIKGRLTLVNEAYCLLQL